VERAADLPVGQLGPVAAEVAEEAEEAEEESVSVRAEAASRDRRGEASASVWAGHDSIQSSLPAESGAQTRRQGRSG
jgi:hypothetical protein